MRESIYGSSRVTVKEARFRYKSLLMRLRASAGEQRQRPPGSWYRVRLY
jgi:hypothetical protein